MGGSLAGRLAGVALGLVLLVAGVAKRVDRSWPDAAAAMGAPRWSAAVLPWLEVALGALLIAGVARPLVATVAGVLLAGFTVVIARNLARGRRPPCACFGAGSRRPIGPASLVRNVALLGLAVVAALA